MAVKQIVYDAIRSGTARSPGLLRAADWKRWTDRTDPATAAKPGTMSAADKAKLDAIYQSMPSVRVAHSVGQSIPNATSTVLAFNVDRFNNYGMHSTVTNNSRLTVPAGKTGLYLFGYTVYFDAAGAGNRHVFQVRADGSTFMNADETSPAVIAGGGFVAGTGAGLYPLAAGQYLELVVYQASGGAVLVLSSALYTPEFWMVRLSDP